MAIPALCGYVWGYILFPPKEEYVFGIGLVILLLLIIYAPLVTLTALVLDLLKINKFVLKELLPSIIFSNVPLIVHFSIGDILEYFGGDISYTTGWGCYLDYTWIYILIIRVSSFAY